MTSSSDHEHPNPDRRSLRGFGKFLKILAGRDDSPRSSSDQEYEGTRLITVSDGETTYIGTFEPMDSAHYIDELRLKSVPDGGMRILTIPQPMQPGSQIHTIYFPVEGQIYSQTVIEFTGANNDRILQASSPGHHNAVHSHYVDQIPGLFGVPAGSILLSLQQAEPDGEPSFTPMVAETDSNRYSAVLSAARDKQLDQ